MAGQITSKQNLPNGSMLIKFVTGSYTSSAVVAILVGGVNAGQNLGRKPAQTFPPNSSLEQIVINKSFKISLASFSIERVGKFW